MPDTNINLSATGDSALIEIKVALARIEERQVSLQKADEYAQSAADHRHRNMMTVIEQFVPRREIEAKEKALSDRIDAVEAKVSTVEKRMWGAIGTAGAAIFGVFLEKLGIRFGG